MKRICIVTSEAAEALDVFESIMVRLDWAFLNHEMRLGKFTLVHWEPVTEAIDALLLAGFRLFMTPSVTTEALSRYTSAFQKLATLCFGKRWRSTAWNAQCFTNARIITNARRLDGPKVSAEAHNHCVHRRKSHHNLAVQANIQGHVMHSSVNECLLIALWIWEPRSFPAATWSLGLVCVEPNE
jgi:hypothetical protein